MPHVAYEVYAFNYDDRTINYLRKVLYPVLNSHNLVNTFFYEMKCEAASKHSSEVEAVSDKIRIGSHDIGMIMAERSI